MTEGIGWLRGVIFDAEDPEKLAAFWQAVLGVGVAKRVPGWIALEPGRSGVLLAFQPVDERRPETIKVRLDIEVPELAPSTPLPGPRRPSDRLPSGFVKNGL